MNDYEVLQKETAIIYKNVQIKDDGIEVTKNYTYLCQLCIISASNE